MRYRSSKKYLDNKLTKKYIIEEYSVNKKSCKQIALECNCCDDTIHNYLKKLGIYQRSKSESKIIKYWLFDNILSKLNKELLEKEYNDGLSMKEIAKKYNISITSIYRRFRYFKIKSRTHSELSKGKNNPMYGKKRPEISGRNNVNYKEKIETKCSYCNKKLLVNEYRIKKTKDFFCSKDHFYLWKRKNQLGNKNPNWKKGISKLPYAFEFNESLKEILRKRDNYTCQLCNKKQKQLKSYHKKLSIHHIDYNKQNNKKSNLITLCSNCHLKTNGNRIYWLNCFKEIINGNLPHQ